MDEQKTIAKGAFWALFSQFGVKLLAFVYMIVIAHFLPPDTIGLFYLALSILGILYIFTDLGIVYALNRYVPYFYAKGQFENLRRLVRFSYVGGGGFTLLFSILVFLSATWLSGLFSQPLLEPALRGLALWLFLQELFDISRGIMNGMKHVRDSQLLEVVMNTLRFLFTLVAFVWFGYTLASLILPYLAAFILVTLVALYYAWKEIRKWPRAEGENTQAYLPLGREVISFGFVIMITSTFWTLLQYIDRIMLNALLPDSLAGVGVYSIATGFASLILLFPGAISVIFFPVISELYGKEKKKEMHDITIVSIKWLIMLSLPLAILMVVFPQELLQMFYGSTYAAGYGVLVLFSLGFFIRSLSMLPGLVIATLRRLDVELLTAVVAAVLNILLNFWFIPQWGINGAALASALSLLVVTLLLFYYSRKLFGFSLPLSSLRPLAAGILTLLLFLLLKPLLVSTFHFVDDLVLPLEGLPLLIARKLLRLLIFGGLFLLASLLYLGALLALKALTRGEVALLQSALRRAKVPETYIERIGVLMALGSTG